MYVHVSQGIFQFEWSSISSLVTRNYCGRLKKLIRDSKKPSLNGVESFSNNENDIDEIVMAYIHFASVSKRFDPEYLDVYFDLSRVILSRLEDVPKPDEDSLAAEIALWQQGRSRSDYRPGSILLQRLQLCIPHCAVHGESRTEWNRKELYGSRDGSKRILRCLYQPSWQTLRCISPSFEDGRFHRESHRP